MLTGTAERSSWDNAVIASPRNGRALDLGKARWLQLTYEPTGNCEALFPKGLHPTNPVAITIQVLDVAQGDLGAFRMAQVRLSCRAGVRVRAFLLGNVVNTPAAAQALSEGWGFANTVGEIDLLWRTDRINAAVRAGGADVLDMSLRAPASIGPDDLHHSVNVNMARCDGELQLLQADFHFTTLSVQRGKPEVTRFDAAFWGLANNPPTYPIIAAAAEVSLAITPVQYIQNPDIIAQLGTANLQKVNA
jgi:hypothetical protein